MNVKVPLLIKKMKCASDYKHIFLPTLYIHQIIFLFYWKFSLHGDRWV